MVAGAIAKDIIFRIGSSGGAATAAKIAAVTAGLVILAKKTADMVNSAEKFGQLVRKNNTDMAEFNTATKGLIDTTESYIGANKMQLAGLRLTAEQMAAVGRAAITNAQATGQDATQAYLRLAEGISKGSTRALRELGIELENTDNLVLAQQEAIDKLSEKYGNANVEIETSQERFYALNNTLGTLQDQLVLGAFESFTAAVGDSGTAVGQLTDWLGALSVDLSETDGQLAQWIFTTDGLTHSSKLLGNIIANKLIPWTDEYSKNIEILNNNYDKTIVKMKTIAMASKSLRRAGEIAGELMTFEILSENEVNAQNAAMEARKRRERLARKPGKRRESPESELKSDIVSERMKAAIDWQLEMLRKQSEEELRIQEEKERQKLIIQETADRAAANLRADQLRAIEQQAKLETQMRKTQAQAGMQALSDLSTLQNTQSRSAFNVGKIAAISEATIQTTLGAQKSFTALAGIPIVGPALGAAAATAAIAAGAVRINQIASTTFDGGGSLGTSASAGATSVSAAAQNASVNTGGSQDVIDRRPINIVVDGRIISDTVINDSIRRQKQGERGLEVRF